MANIKLTDDSLREKIPSTPSAPADKPNAFWCEMDEHWAPFASRVHHRKWCRECLNRLRREWRANRTEEERELDAVYQNTQYRKRKAWMEAGRRLDDDKTS